LINPKSFTQTVENIFHYSFLVKKGSASIALRDKALDLSGVTTKPGLAIKYVTERPTPPPAKQAIMTLTMQDWRDLCAAYAVEEGDLPHRRINQEAYAASLSQAN
jgi:non-structural maintenance of chromosomes element 4